MTISPPEYELRPETRARQRAELIAIVEHEAATIPRPRFVPLVAAAAVVAITAGLAIGIPALRNDNGQPPVSGTEKTGQAAEKSTATTIVPLSDADKARFGKACFERGRMRFPRAQPEKYQVLDGFRFANGPRNAYTRTWVVIHNTSLNDWAACGMDDHGSILQVDRNGLDQVQYRAVEGRMIGAGSYAAHITRITVAVGDQEPVDAVLRNGFFYTAVPYVRVRGPRTKTTRLPYTIIGYDAAGKVVYRSPKNDGEWHAQGNACYIDPNGKLVAWMSDNPHPDPKTCRRSFIWNYLPR